VTSPEQGSRTGPDTALRVATPADADALVALRAVMFEAMGLSPEAVADPVWRAASRAWFAERVEAPGVRVVVADDAGEVVSAAVGEVTGLIPGPNAPNGTVGLISNVATRHTHRRRGLAAACTDDLLHWFEHDTEVTRIDLFATPEGARLYSPRGFRPRGFEGMCLRLTR
jgi:GNAT superfamily N-acetyltransferase